MRTQALSFWDCIAEGSIAVAETPHAKFLLADGEAGSLFAAAGYLRLFDFRS